MISIDRVFSLRMRTLPWTRINIELYSKNSFVVENKTSENVILSRRIKERPYTDWYIEPSNQLRVNCLFYSSIFHFHFIIMTNTASSKLITEPLENDWTHVEYISCEKCLEHAPEHADEMLERLFKATGTPKKDFIYKQVVKIINETFENNQDKAKEIRQQVRKLINAHMLETAQHVCLSIPNKPAFQFIAEELLLLPNLFLLNKETELASFYQLERFLDFYGRVKLTEHGRQAIQSSQRNSSTMLRGRNLYSLDQGKSTFEIRLQIEHFHSPIYIGICSDNVPPNEIEEASNKFPIDPPKSAREGDIFQLLIDVNNYTIYLWNEYRPKKYQNTEQHKRERIISRRKCPLPWRYFVILTGKNNHVRIVY